VVVPFFSGYALPCLTGRVCHVNLSWLAKKQGRRKSVVLSRLCGAQLSFLWGFIVRAEQAARLCRYPFGRSKAKQIKTLLFVFVVFVVLGVIFFVDRRVILI